MTGTGSPARAAWRERLRVVLFESATPGGKAFDVALFLAIVASVSVVMAESVRPVRLAWGGELDALEWLFTALFTVEYGLRLVSVPRPLRYAGSFFGVIDLLALLPSYLSLVLPGGETLLVIRGLRLLRVFRVFKLGRYLGEANLLVRALSSSRHKILVFLGTVLILVTILGAGMYLVEGEPHGFTSIPMGVYWAIVTLTTVGYGDVVPQTLAGRALSALVMILGYSIIAVPTGIVTAEIVESAVAARRAGARNCPACRSEGHEPLARFCKDCGRPLDSGPGAG